MDRGRGACVYRGVAGTCDSRHIVVMAVLHYESVFHESLETAVAEFRLKAVQIFVAHLIYDDTYNQFRWLSRFLLLRLNSKGENDGDEYNYLFHIKTLPPI